MEPLSSQTVALLQFVWPGFLAAWLFYQLTTHPKPPQFERFVGAILLAFVIEAIVAALRLVLETLGTYWSVRPWDAIATQAASATAAIATGLLVSHLTNTDKVHGWLRKVGLTTRSSSPSTWASTFAGRAGWIVLQLNDGRRIMGWLKQWPLDSSSGHFLVTHPTWIDEAGQGHDPTGIGGILIASRDVHWIEFVCPADNF